MRRILFLLIVGVALWHAHGGALATEDYLSGTSYVPDWWPRSYWNEAFRKMHESGFNVVRRTEFAWASLEPKPEEFEFAWLDEAVRLAQQNGITLILTTPTSGRPPWRYKAHPGVLGAKKKGDFTLVSLPPLGVAILKVKSNPVR